MCIRDSAKGIRPEDLAKTQYVFDSLSPQERASFGKGPYGGDRILVGAALANSWACASAIR